MVLKGKSCGGTLFSDHIKIPDIFSKENIFKDINKLFIIFSELQTQKLKMQGYQSQNFPNVWNAQVS